MINEKLLSIESIGEGRWQGTQGCCDSPCSFVSPRSNTEITGRTGDQRATIDDCTRFWMSCATQTKWMAPFKMTSEVSKKASVVPVRAFRFEHYFPVLLALLLRVGRECEKGSHHSDFFPIRLFQRETKIRFVGFRMRLKSATTDPQPCHRYAHGAQENGSVECKIHHIMFPFLNQEIATHHHTVPQRSSHFHSGTVCQLIFIQQWKMNNSLNK